MHKMIKLIKKNAKVYDILAIFSIDFSELLCKKVQMYTNNAYLNNSLLDIKDKTKLTSTLEIRRKWTMPDKWLSIARKSRSGMSIMGNTRHSFVP